MAGGPGIWTGSVCIFCSCLMFGDAAEVGRMVEPSLETAEPGRGTVDPGRGAVDTGLGVPVDFGIDEGDCWTCGVADALFCGMEPAAARRGCG